ncbi:MAG: amidohydrolase family protein [Xanthobacteraceae bacterium]
MNIPVRETRSAQKFSFVDGDIHPAFRAPSDLYPFLPARWRDHLLTFGEHLRQGLSGQLAYPRMMASGMRADAFPEQGPPGSDLEMMRKQHLDANGVEYGMLVALSRGGMEERNLDFAAALSQAVNDWQIEAWVKPEPRLRAGIVVPQEDAAFAASEIERRAPDRRFVQAIFSPRASDPVGHRRYWSIYEAAERHNLPVGLHSAGFSGGHPSTGSGWPTYYMQEHYAFSTAMQSVVTSMIFEGVFERFPKLKIVLIEGGFSWAPALGWRMDKHWERMRAETPHVKRPPSEYLRQNFWFTTQPIEEPQKPAHLADIIGWLGWDRLIFSSDYPHWDFDHPRHAFKFALTDKQKAMVFRDNAKAVYGLQ